MRPARPPRTGLNFGLDTGPCPATQTTNGAKNEGASEPNPNIFANPDEAIKSFRFSAMGERGQRNVMRGDSYASADLAFRKAFDMPYSDASQLGVPAGDLQSHQHAVLRHGSLNMSLEDPATFGRSSALLGGPWRMQVSVRYDF